MSIAASVERVRSVSPHTVGILYVTCFFPYCCNHQCVYLLDSSSVFKLLWDSDNYVCLLHLFIFVVGILTGMDFVM